MGSDCLSRVEEPHGSGSTGIFFEGRVLERRRTRFQELLVLENRDYGRVLLLDGKVMTTERDAPFYHEPLVHPAMTAHPKPRRVCVVGGGDGGTVTELVRYTEIENILVIEIDPEVVEASRKWLPSLAKGFGDPRVRIVHQDAARYLAGSGDLFDVIICDGADPVGPASVLFTMEFYRNVARSLDADGIFVSQMEGPLFFQEQISTALKNISEAFEWYCPWPAVVPTYPGAVWCFAWAGIGRAPQGPVRPPPQELLVYTQSNFPPTDRVSLPSFIRKLLPTREP